eukprot:maker-scaffold1969_size23727-snap-gene-0.6 protein:Tk10246 transcript:maker-scaffold1969_size23727-snap-gene-0.6-mRNA-1 annotation:"spore germination protein"
MSLRAQREFLFTCLDAKLISQVRDGIDGSTPVIGSTSCMSVLELIFGRRIPLYIRRVNWFKSNQGPTQDPLHYLVQIKEAGLEAGVGEMSGEENYKFWFLSGLHDVDLKEKLFALKGATLADIVEATSIHVSAFNCAQACADPGTFIRAVTENEPVDGCGNVNQEDGEPLDLERSEEAFKDNANLGRSEEAFEDDADLDRSEEAFEDDADLDRSEEAFEDDEAFEDGVDLDRSEEAFEDDADLDRSEEAFEDDVDLDRSEEAFEDDADLDRSEEAVEDDADLDRLDDEEAEDLEVALERSDEEHNVESDVEGSSDNRGSYTLTLCSETKHCPNGMECLRASKDSAVYACVKK